jgi:hypothetical protein
MDVLTKPMSAKDLVPWYYNVTPINSDEDLIFLGKVTIQEFIRHWRKEEARFFSDIEYTQEIINLLKGKTGEDFAKLAEEFENPNLSIGKIPVSRRDILGPVDKKSQKRKSGSTTFNICGWCKYARSGGNWHDCFIDPNCDIFDLAFLPVNRPKLSDEFKIKRQQHRFDTPCFLPKISKDDVDQFQRAIECKKSELIEKKKEVVSKIEKLLIFEEEAEEKPAFPNIRPLDWFNIGDKVVCFIGGWEDKTLPDTWLLAEVVNGHRHHDGGVSVVYDKKYHITIKGKSVNYGSERPEIMLLWEFEYLKQHPEFAEIWVKIVPENIGGFNPQGMLKDLRTVD